MIARPTGTHRRPPSTPRFHQIRRFVAEPHVLLHEMLREYGDFMCWRGFHDVYLVNHPEFIRPVLSQDYRHFSKHTIDYRVLARVMGNGLVSWSYPAFVDSTRLSPTGLKWAAADGNKALSITEGTVSPGGW